MAAVVIFIAHISKLAESSCMTQFGGNVVDVL
jgi:hypothetical protein